MPFANPSGLDILTKPSHLPWINSWHSRIATTVPFLSFTLLGFVQRKSGWEISHRCVWDFIPPNLTHPPPPAQRNGQAREKPGRTAPNGSRSNYEKLHHKAGRAVV